MEIENVYVSLMMATHQPQSPLSCFPPAAEVKRRFPIRKWFMIGYLSVRVFFTWPTLRDLVVDCGMAFHLRK